MGRVFLPEALERNEFPNVGAHELAGQAILDGLIEQPSEEWAQLWPLKKFINESQRLQMWRDDNDVRGAMIYGSTVLGKAGIRSDVDVFISYRERSEGILNRVNRLFQEVEDRYNVPIEPHAISVDAQMSPLMHSIDPLFAAHLINVQNNFPDWSRNWPVRDLEQGWVMPHLGTRQEIAIRYVSAKAKQFARSLLNTRPGAVDYQAFQRALEIPGAIGRKVIPALSDQDLEIDTTDKRLTLHHTKAMGELGLTSVYGERLFGDNTKQQQLEAKDREYDEVLHQTIHGQESIAYYDRWLHQNYREAISLAYQVSTMWRDALYALRHRRTDRFGTVTLFDQHELDHGIGYYTPSAHSFYEETY